MRSLNVFFHEQLVGDLAENGNIWQFNYSDEWLRSGDGFDLSPALPRSDKTIVDGASQRPVQWYFDNLLPEEVLRQVVAGEAGLQWEDAFGLLTYYGAESAGALVMHPPEMAHPTRLGRKTLAPDQLSQRIRQLPKSSLQKNAPKRMFLAGAQHKLLVIVEGDRIYEPEAATPSTHILKPNHPGEEYPASVMNEYFIMRLAHDMGLETPNVEMRYIPEPVYIVERFDRALDIRGQTSRAHVIDACQLLNKDRTFKYSGATMDSLAQSISWCRCKAAARLGLFRWLVFNVLVGNGNNHLKNISFLNDHEGIRTAPTYDLLSTAVYDTPALADSKARWPASELALKIGKSAPAFGDITQKDLIAAGVLLGLNEKTAARELARQTGTLLATADHLIDKVIAEQERLMNASPAPSEARRYRGIEEKVLLAIRHIILRDMVARLG